MYKYKDGAIIKVDANIAAEQCEILASQGMLTAKNLVDISRPEDAPLHNAFEWNDSVAAEQYREQQARKIINSLVIVKKDQEPVRMYFNLVKKAPEYKRIDLILSDADDKEKLLQLAYREMLAFKKKYETLTELAKVFEAIDQLDIA